MKINDIINEHRVVVVQTGFKGMVDIASAVADMLTQTADLSTEDKEAMSALASRILEMSRDETLDPAIVGLVLLQMGVTLLELTPNYALAKVMERNPCPNGSPLN